MRRNLHLLFILAAWLTAMPASSQQSAETLAQLKACSQGEVEFTIPAGAFVSGTGSLYSANVIFLWDGTDGVKLVFDTADGDIYAMVQQRPIGQQLSGFIYGRYEPDRKDGPALVCNYGTDKTNYYRELQLQPTDAALPDPLTPTISQLLEATTTGSTAYDNAYVKVEGAFMITDSYKLFDADNHNITANRDYLGINAQGEYAFDFDPAVGKQGYLYAIFEVNREPGTTPTCRFAVVNPDKWFDATGDVVATQTITFDASPTASNTYGEEMSSVNVQILGFHYRAGGLYPLYLPMDIQRSELLQIFGTDARLMMLSNVGSRVNAKQIMLYFETQEDYTQTSAWSVYLIQPSQDVDEPTFHNVHLENGAYVMRLNKYAGNTTHGNVYFYNTYNPVTLLTDGTHRIIQPDGAIVIPEEGQNIIGAFTAYLDLTQWYQKHPSADEPERLYLTIDGKEVTSGIDTTPNDKEQTTNSSVYDLQGRRINPAKTITSGLYIRNGKKLSNNHFQFNP